LRVNLPSVELVQGNQYSTNGRLRWTRNLMHNLISECCITFNDLVAARFDNYHLDFWAAFTVPAGKLNGYKNMIGDFDDLTAPHASGDAIPAYTLNLPLPFFFARDSGVALPTAALPYNEMRITYSFRDWTELLIVDNLAAPANTNPSRPATSADLVNGAPQLGQVQTWANYAIVSNDERKRMACAPRNILIEQCQTAPRQTFAPATNAQPSYDIRFSHAIKALFFAARNKTLASEWSVYGTASPQGSGINNWTVKPDQGFDPISQTSLVYENTARLSQMGSDYFSLVNPWYHAPSVPDRTGYHCYSYSLDFFCLDPMGSTNYGKLTNVSIRPEASNAAQASVTPSGSVGGITNPNGFANSYDFIVTVVNNNIIRVSGGALGFPVL